MPTGEQPMRQHLLAADRVYLLRMSPCVAVGSYPTLAFAKNEKTVRPAPKSTALFSPLPLSNCRAVNDLAALAFGEAVLFLWHFP